MRNAPNLALERYRVDGVPRTPRGAFRIPRKGAGGPTVELVVVIGDGAGWDHASVSTRYRTPTWEEMEFVRELAFRDDECVMQLSVPRGDHINAHPHVLHLWRPQTAEERDCARADHLATGEEWLPEWDRLKAPGPIPRPPGWMVAPDGMTQQEARAQASGLARLHRELEG